MPSPLFIDRIEAAEALATRLREYQGRNPLILAIRPGAVPMGKVLAERLEGELDIVLLHKLGAPFDPEYAIGAIDETGWTWFSPDFEDDTGKLIEQAKSRQLAALKSLRARLTPHVPPADPRGRLAIVMDDGLATGATMITALHAVRARKPSELVCAVPLAAADSLDRVVPLVDKLVCLHVRRHFGSVSRYYSRFHAVDEEEVARILTDAASRRG